MNGVADMGVVTEPIREVRSHLFFRVYIDVAHERKTDWMAASSLRAICAGLFIFVLC